MSLKSVVLVLCLTATSSFSPSSLPTSSLATSLRSTPTDEPVASDSPVIETPSPSLPTNSIALPFLKRPKNLDGTLAGDAGFDPIGFSNNAEDLYKYREAEVKHARLAMLAAAGWPISELADKGIAGALHLNPLLDSADRVPSLLNGGLSGVSPLYWGFCL